MALTADEAFGVVRADGPEMSKAKAFLQTFLGSGTPCPEKLVEEKAVEAGISRRTLNRAKKKLRIASSRAGYGDGGEWLWTLPVGGDEQ